MRLDWVAEILQRNTRLLNRRSRSYKRTWVVCHMREFSRPPSYFTRRESAWFPSLFLFFSLSFLAFSFSAGTRTAILPCDTVFFFPRQYNFPAAWYRLPLLNSIRHDTSLFLEAFRHRDRLDECSSRYCHCSKVAFLCQRCDMPSYAGRTRQLPFSRREKYSCARHKLRSLSSLAN